MTAPTSFVNLFKTIAIVVGNITEIKNPDKEISIAPFSPNINDAEYKAIELALKDFPNEDIRSDNDTAVNKFRNEHKKLNVSFIGRQWNIANTIVRSAMEISKAKSPNKF